MSLGAIAAVAIIMTTFAMPPADAAKKAKGYRPATITTPTSLDGRITGRTRTCGYYTLQYSASGAPHGPYCHCLGDRGQIACAPCARGGQRARFAHPTSDRPRDRGVIRDLKFATYKLANNA